MAEGSLPAAPVVITGFCRFCHNWLREHHLTEHASREDCITALLNRVAHYQRAADMEHDWVHRLEDVIADLRLALAETGSHVHDCEQLLTPKTLSLISEARAVLTRGAKS